MRIERLMVILDDWSSWMKSDNHKLGYPNKVSYMSSGGESTADVFEDMVGKTDNENVKILNACIHSLDKEQREAVYARWLGSKKPVYYELKLDLAMDNLLTMVGKRIYA
jgi:hypothetical protein|tara:strand:+ start:1268 stop:1594 length:327 start_codon:yes stop_codon:yes gene_type:complete